MEGDLTIFCLGREMHDGLAATKLVFICLIVCRQRWQPAAKIDQQLVAILPVIEKAEFIDDFAGGFSGTVHGVAPGKGRGI